MSKKQQLLTQFIPNEGKFEKGSIRLNAIEIEIISFIAVFLYKVIVVFSNEKIHKNHIIRKINNKTNTICAGYYQETVNESEIFVVSLEEIEPFDFNHSGTKFTLVPMDKKVDLNVEDSQDNETIRELIYNYVTKECTLRGFLKPGSVRTSSGRHSKGFMLNKNRTVSSKKYNAFWYHGYEAILISVKKWRINKFIVALDTLLPILKTPYPSSDGFKKMIENGGKWVPTKLLPDSVSNHFLPQRKKNAKARLKGDLSILNSLNFDLDGIQNNGPFKTKKYTYLEEPVFLFGNNFSDQVPKNTILSEFIAPRLKKHGPYIEFEKPIRIQPLVMKQLEENYGLEKIKNGLTDLGIVYRSLYKQDIVVLEPIILGETEDQTEWDCSKLSRKFNKDFDIVVAFLKGAKFNHPFRSAIKKGLQYVPSQIIKYKNMNQLKIFRDVMSHSILSQINYKAAGKIMTPVDPKCLENFDLRIYYDLGRFLLKNRTKPLNSKPIALVGSASLISNENIYTFQAVSQINDIDKIEITSRTLVRSIITEIIKMYLETSELKIINGNLLIQRDGKGNKEEYDEAEAVLELLRDGDNALIGQDCNWSFVEFHKKPVVRLFSHYPDLAPRRGTFFKLDENNAYLTTTGFPDIHSVEEKDKDKQESVGVAVSLEISRIAEGGNKKIPIKSICKDVYYRTFMWMASFQKTRNIAEANMIHELFDLRRQGVNNPPKWIC